MEMENKNTPIEEVTPKRRGRKPKADAETNVEATPKKRGRKPKTDEEVPSVETPKKRTRRTKKEIEDALAEAVNETMPDAIAYTAEQEALSRTLERFPPEFINAMDYFSSCLEDAFEKHILKENK